MKKSKYKYLYQELNHFMQLIKVLKNLNNIDKNFYSWGWNEHSNLGTGDSKNVWNPICIKNDNLKIFLNKFSDNENKKLKVNKSFI